MCTGGEVATAFGASKGASEGRRALEDANIIHGRPDVEAMRREAELARRQAEQSAANLAGTRIRARRNAARQNSLITGGGMATAGEGRATLGV